jgi:3-methyladenine DNA glycosylase AlkD
LRELESLGTEQNRKIYRRHGVGEQQFGVSFGNLEKLRKRIKVDHQLAQQLWASGNHDARILATMVADPRQVDQALLEQWVAELDNYPLTDQVANLASRTSLARSALERWVRADGEWVARAGWQLLAHLAMKDPDLSESYFQPYLATIEQDIHQQKNRVREAMNGALIAIGLRSEQLQQAAIAIARRIGKVQVDHGETSCKTPDAEAYIRKAASRARAVKRVPNVKV